METMMNEEFTIKDDSTAEWAVQRIAEETAEFERLKELAEQKIEELKNKIADLEEQNKRKTSFLKSCLAMYFETVPHKETKTQETYKLLSGTLVFKKPKQKIVKNDEKLVEYFKRNNMTDFIKVEEKPQWNEYKKNLSIVEDKVIDTTTGEVVDVLEIEEEAGSFEVKL